MPPPARRPSRMAAKGVVGSATFLLTSQVSINVNREISTHTSASTFVLSANGDAMSGTMARPVEGMDILATPLPVTGRV